jgi:hypothetical protein
MSAITPAMTAISGTPRPKSPMRVTCLAAGLAAARRWVRGMLLPTKLLLLDGARAVTLTEGVHCRHCAIPIAIS